MLTLSGLETLYLRMAAALAEFRAEELGQDADEDADFQVAIGTH